VIGALWAGLAVAGSIPLDLWMLTVTLAAAVLLMLVTRRARSAFLLFLVCFFVLGYLRSPEAPWNRLKSPALDPGCRKFPCIVRVSGPSPLGRWRQPVKVRAESILVGFPWLESRLLFLRDAGAAGAVHDGGGMALGTFYAPRPRLNPYGWNTALRYRREGVLGTVVARSFVAGSAPGRLTLSRFRGCVGRLVHSAGTDKTRGVLEALLLGERTDLCPEVKEVMVRAGTYHVIAISGLHVGIVVLLVTSLITMAGPPRALRIALAVFCVVAYVVLTGARPSAQRAGTLFLILSLTRYIQWKVDIPNCVCAAGVVLLLAFPYLAWDIGFRLSLAAVFGITLLVPQLYAGGRTGGVVARIREYIQLGLLASFAAQIAALPILLYHFGRVSLIGVLSNLIVLPLVTLAVAAGLEAWVAVLLWERLGMVFMKGASAFVTLIIMMTSFLTQHIDPVVFTGRPHIAKLLAYVCALGYVGLGNPRLKRHWRLLSLIALYAFLIAPVFQERRPGTVLTFIHVGDGDACLVEFEWGETLMIDTGAGGGDYDAGRLDVLPLLAMKGLKRLDTVIITHSHNDHYGGLASLLGNVEIGQVLIGAPKGEAGYLKVLERCGEHGVQVNRIARGDTLTYGDAVIAVFHPSEAYLGSGIDDPNAQSVVLKLIYGKTEFLFTGDVTPEVQRELMNLGFDLTCDVLKVPHHGAPGGVDPAHARTCGARYAIVSAGSRFASHPCPDILQLLERSGARTLVTKSHGAVTIVTDGESLRVRTEVLGPVGPASLLDVADRRW
jgi:competence protein ComEC